MPQWKFANQFLVLFFSCRLDQVPPVRSDQKGQFLANLPRTRESLKAGIAQRQKDSRQVRVNGGMRMPNTVPNKVPNIP